MESEELKAYINSAIEPLIVRISALQAENQEIKAIVKSLQSAKPTHPTPKSGPAPNTNNNSVKKLPNVPKGQQKKEGHKVEQQKKQDHHEHQQNEDGEPKGQNTGSSQKKQPVKPTTAVGNRKPGTSQADHKGGIKTPQVDKKVPSNGNSGKNPVVTDKTKNPKLKTETGKQDQNKNDEQHKEGEKGSEGHEPKEANHKQQKSKQKKPNAAKPSHKDPVKSVHHPDNKNVATANKGKAVPKQTAPGNGKKVVNGGDKKKGQQEKKEKVQQTSVQSTENKQPASQQKQQVNNEEKAPQAEAPKIEATQAQHTQVQNTQQPPQEQVNSGEAPVVEGLKQ